MNRQLLALAYEITKEKLEDKKILVFHLGGSTFDISILGYENEQKDNIFDQKNLKLLSIYRDNFLGGKDFDNALVEYVIKKYNIPKEIKEKIKVMKR